MVVLKRGKQNSETDKGCMIVWKKERVLSDAGSGAWVSVINAEWARKVCMELKIVRKKWIVFE